VKEFIENSELRYFLAGFTSYVLHDYRNDQKEISVVLPAINLLFHWTFQISDGYFILKNDLQASHPKYNTNRAAFINSYTKKLFRVRSQEIKDVLNELFKDKSGKQLLNVTSIYKTELNGFLDLYRIKASIIGDLEQSVIVKYFKSKAGKIYPHGTPYPYDSL
jgi:hypothetical protein